MRILIIGYGKMGKEIESLAQKQGHTIAGIIDNQLQREHFNEKADVAVEFSTPSTVIDNLIWCFENNIPVVTGTTAWLQHLDSVSEKCKLHNGTLLWGTNFSPGMNIMFLLNSYLSNVMNAFPNYKATITETHHIHKLDKPSGTAITLAQDIAKNNSFYKTWSLDASSEDNQNIPIYAIREGEAKGKHIVKYESCEDIISLEHDALNRNGFATGALLAAQWLCDKSGIFSFPEFFQTFLNNKKQ
jgi:4-hydroxy-tetrahydrodipicolinate reductase